MSTLDHVVIYTLIWPLLTTTYSTTKSKYRHTTMSKAGFKPGTSELQRLYQTA